MDKKIKNKIIISMTDLEDFCDMLVWYGVTKDNEFVEKIGGDLKAFLVYDDFKLKQDFKDFFEGYLVYKENQNK